ncbi:MAG: nitrous oxide reductase family maturation protein NosD [Desulfobacteraceae bacterium]|nr:nitrous oxide reductase family maturation protein NosD [Desulfobacteraceae bacterium]
MKTFFLTLIICFTACIAFAEPDLSLQEKIEQTLEGETVLLEPGVYAGPVTIEKRVILDGKGQVTIDGLGKKSVLILKADGIIIKNLTITNSGDSHDRVDAGILVRSSKNQILNNKIENSLFGIDFQESHKNIITGNEISSKKNVKLGLRGDGIRVWASHGNVFRKNLIHDSRDMVIWYSNDNIIEENKGWNNRYSLHFMYAGGNEVRRNSYHHNSVGIFLMYSRDIILEHNVVRYSLGGTGVGIGIKESDNMSIQNNEIVYCSTGIYFDISPYQPDKYNFIKANTVAYNITGINFNSTVSRNIFKGNAFIDNLNTLSVNGNGVATGNHWEGNYYSDYEGFDRDRDGYGDFTYNHDIYLDTLWMDNDWMLLFHGSPVISVINLLAQLAPISEPRRLMTDLKPVFSPKSPVLFSKANLKYDPPAIEIEDDDDEDMPARFASDDDDEEDEDMPARFASDDDDEEDDNRQNKNDNYNRYYFKQ